MSEMRGQDLYKRAKLLIPGGTQLLSKRPEMFLPEQWPAYYSRAKGVSVWDLDGRELIDMSLMGIGACVLGYADDDVNAAARSAIDAGVMCTLNAPEEVELAELLCEIHPWAEMVRYARTGGEAMAIAVRLARAASGRDVVAFCGYHGWSDWYLAANLADEGGLDGHLLPGLDPAGVPRGLAGTALPFRYNDLAALEGIVRERGRELAAIVIEPLRSSEPVSGFLEGVRRIAREVGAVLVFDEVSSGFRSLTGGIHLRLGVEPDLAVFAKGMSNGYPMAAIIGRASVMDAAQRTFISSTFWSDRLGPAAALATIAKHRRQRVGEHLDRIGNAMHAVWRRTAERHGLRLTIHGQPALSHYDIESERSREVHTYVNQALLAAGILGSRNFYASYAHTEAHIAVYERVLDSTFNEVARALRDGSIDRLLKGPVHHTGFARLA